MKNFILGICAVSLLSGCAGMRVCKTDVASGAVNPKAIYIRPFAVNYAQYDNGLHPGGPVKKSLAPVEFANILEEELSKIAPAMVLADDEVPVEGWVVDGEIESLDSCGFRPTKIHVRITDLSACPPAIDGKENVSEHQAVRTSAGSVVYEFDLRGNYISPRPFGSVTAPGVGDAVPFEFRNAAERIYLALTPDPFRYGYRSSPVARN